MLFTFIRYELQGTWTTRNNVCVLEVACCLKFEMPCVSTTAPVGVKLYTGMCIFFWSWDLIFADIFSGHGFSVKIYYYFASRCVTGSDMQRWCNFLCLWGHYNVLFSSHRSRRDESAEMKQIALTKVLSNNLEESCWPKIHSNDLKLK